MKSIHILYYAVCQYLCVFVLNNFLIDIRVHIKTLVYLYLSRFSTILAFQQNYWHLLFFFTKLWFEGNIYFYLKGIGTKQTWIERKKAEEKYTW